MKISVILPAYKEENVKNRVEDILKENLPKNFQLKEIILVLCDTEYESRPSKNIIVIKEKQREGKAIAINKALKKASGDIIVLQSVDTKIKKNTLTKLISLFKDKNIGLTTTHPKPIEKRDNVLGFTINLIWDLHHILSKKTPKAGEMIAFRKIIENIPPDTAADETFVEYIISKNKLKMKYIPSSIVYNYGPPTIRKLFKQRKRIFIAHLNIKKKHEYSVSTMDSFKVMSSMFEYIKNYNHKKRHLIFIPISIMIEISARVIGFLEFYLLKRNPFKWEKVSK